MKSVGTMDYKIIISLIACIVLPVLCLRFGFGEMLGLLDTHMMVASGDGYKNIYTPIYQYLYGSGYTFDGFLYPNGEYVLYTDGQPLLIWFLQLLKSVGLSLSPNQMLMLLQWLPLLSIWIGIYFVYKICRYLDTPTLWSAAIAIACILLSPQIFRIKGHYGLAYLFTLPVVIYSLLKHHREGLSNIWLFTIFFGYNFLLGFIHPYLLMINVLYVLSYELIAFLRGKRSYWVIVLSALSLVVFWVVNKVIDPYADRPEHPFGPYHYRSHFKDIFPIDGWFCDLFLEPNSITRSYEEGYTYLGVLLYILPILVIVYLYQLIRKGTKSSYRVPTYAWAGVLIYLFATGKHIAFTGGYIFKILPPLEQFRGLGRFVIGFYYPIFIFLGIWVYRFLGRFNMKYLRPIALGLVVILWTIDVKDYWSVFHDQLMQYKGNFSLVDNQNVTKKLKELNLDSDDFQAVIPVPVMLEGAETFRDLKNWTAFMNALPYAFQTGSKVVGGIMSRTAVSPASASLQLMSLNNIPKKILTEVQDDRPFLLLANNKKFYINYPGHVPYIEVIDSTDNLLIAKFHPARITQDNECFSKNDSEKGWYYYNGFDTASRSNGLHSEGAIRADDTDVIDKVTVPDSIKTIDFSIWYEVKPSNMHLPEILIDFLNDSGDRIGETYFSEVDLLWYREVVDNWIRIRNNDIHLPDGTQSVVVRKNKKNNASHDHLVLSAVDRFVIDSFSETHKIVNHHFCLQ